MTVAQLATPGTHGREPGEVIVELLAAVKEGAGELEIIHRALFPADTGWGSCKGCTTCRVVIPELQAVVRRYSNG